MDESEKQSEVTETISKVASRIRPWRTVGLLLVATALFSAVALSFSGQYGRLGFDVDYEDVITHIDGLKRYRDFARGGVPGFLGNYAVSPPHAPLHSLMAAASFALFGVHDWAPYVANGVVIFGLFAAMLYAIRGVPGIWLKAGALVFTAGFPLAFLSVHDFRPDYPAAVLSLWGILLLVDRSSQMSCRLRYFLGGVAFAGALLAKPTVFPYTVALGGVAWVIAVGFDTGTPFSTKKLSASVAKTWPFFVANILIALPHFVIAGPKLLAYMIRNQIGADKESWSLKGTFWENSTYHILGYSGDFQLGWQRWLLLGLVVAACVGMIVSKSYRFQLLRLNFPVIAAVTGIAFFGVAINHHDNPYFGLVFQQLLMVAAILVLGAAWMWVSTSAPVVRRSAGVVLALIFLTPSVMGSPWPRFRHAAHSDNYEILEYARSINQRVFDVLEHHLPHVDQGNVLITTYGLISNHTLQWLADREMVPITVAGLPNQSRDELAWSINQREEHHRVVDLIIATEPGAYGVHDFLPSAKTADFMLEQVRSNPEFQEIARIPEPNGTEIRIFRRASRFGGWTRSAGLSRRLPAEEVKNIPVRQHGLWPEVRLVVELSAPAQRILTMRWIPVDANTSMTLMVNGEEVRTFAANGERNWQSNDVPLDLVSGQNSIELKFSSTNPNAPGRAAVTFTDFRITESFR